MKQAVTGQRGQIDVTHLCKSYPLKTSTLEVLRDINLTIRGGESISIVGASGSGKTTFLRVIAGLEGFNSGSLLIDGAPADGVGAERAVIFQEPRLLPWLSVLDNVAFGAQMRGTPKAQSLEEARRFIRLVGLEKFVDAYPRQLSGGMAQRVGIARALTVNPEILLLDEPLGALDAMTKISMQEEIARIWQENGVTMVLVTHDLEEAIFLADRVIIMPQDKFTPLREIAIDLPRPRDRNSAEFVALRRQLMTEFGLH